MNLPKNKIAFEKLEETKKELKKINSDLNIYHKINLLKNKSVFESRDQHIHTRKYEKLKPKFKINDNSKNLLDLDSNIFKEN